MKREENYCACMHAKFLICFFFLNHYHIYTFSKSLSYCVLTYFQENLILYHIQFIILCHIKYDKRCVFSYFCDMIKKNMKYDKKNIWSEGGDAWTHSWLVKEGEWWRRGGGVFLRILRKEGRQTKIDIYRRTEL